MLSLIKKIEEIWDATLMNIIWKIGHTQMQKANNFVLGGHAQTFYKKSMPNCNSLHLTDYIWKMFRLNIRHHGKKTS